MKIAIVGAGIIGVTTAYELTADGHEVTVFERHGAAAEEASFAPAGLIAPGGIASWPAPGKPLGRHAPFKLGLPPTSADLAWLWKWWRACRSEAHAANRARLHRLASYSQHRLHQITADLQLEYDRSEGHLVVLRTEKDRASMQPGLQLLRDAGLKFKEVSPAEARKLEPALNPDTAFAGAIHLEQDEVGNCRQFALLLRDAARRLGAKFEFNSTVARIGRSTRPALAIAGEAAPRTFDAIVLCAGGASSTLLRPLGLKLPLAAVHGYAVSAQIREPLNAPRSAVTDIQHQVAITRLGQRVRVTGGAELGGSPTTPDAHTLQTLYKVLHDWFPGAAQLSQGVQEWKGARPMLPDGPPVIGPSGTPGIWLNLGHGAVGWTLGCGSARALADLMAGQPAGIDLEGLGVERLRG